MSHKVIRVAASTALVLFLVSAGLASGSANPTVTVAPTSGYPGTNFVITCTGFVPGDWVTQRIFLPDGTEIPYPPMVAYPNGDVPCLDWASMEGDQVGVYTIVVEGKDSGEARATFQVLEAPFVPEASTVILFGSGLAGLAGYARLRLGARRKRED